jgi:hypothetical protein
MHNNTDDEEKRPADNERFGASGGVARPTVCADFGSLSPVRAAVKPLPQAAWACVTWTTFIEMLELYYRWEQASRRRLSGAVAKPPYAADSQWFSWWAIRKSGNDDFCRCEYRELNASEPMKKPRKGKRRCQKQIATSVTATECTGNLIIGYAASGVKLARQVFRL